MIEMLKKFVGLGVKVEYAELVKNGASIIDVRSKSEFQGGHIKRAINIPLDTKNSNLSKFKKDKAIITCCASGMRSASAKSILKSNGFLEVYNGGSWMSLQSKIK